ncbi:flavodoxin [Sphingomonas aerolata]|uniref:flavodoxin n=1 Tax=Sphingomonas aerolata TaxID=185951 RepID=UPI002FE0E18F
MLAAPMILGLASGACAEKNETRRMKNAKTLVAYLTRSGNTRVIAGTLQRALGADLFEIKPARPYPEDYEQHVAQATRERDSEFEPPLAEKVTDIATYDEIYLGFPVWGETMPPPVRSFLKTHDLRGKTILTVYHSRRLWGRQQPVRTHKSRAWGSDRKGVRDGGRSGAANDEHGS